MMLVLLLAMVDAIFILVRTVFFSVKPKMLEHMQTGPSLANFVWQNERSACWCEAFLIWSFVFFRRTICIFEWINRVENIHTRFRIFSQSVSENQKIVNIFRSTSCLIRNDSQQQQQQQPLFQRHIQHVFYPL